MVVTNITKIMYRNSAVNGKNDYAQYRVEQEMPLLEFLFTAVKES